jgi:hypothetical protein
MLLERIAGLLLLSILASTGLFASQAALPQTETLAEPAAAPALEIACQQDLTGEPMNGLEAPLSPSFFEPVQKSTCNCDTRCGVCGGRLRGCFNGIPFCECFQC